jgi:hypothetical protein
MGSTITNLFYKYNLRPQGDLNPFYRRERAVRDIFSKKRNWAIGNGFELTYEKSNYFFDSVYSAVSVDSALGAKFYDNSTTVYGTSHTHQFTFLTLDGVCLLISRGVEIIRHYPVWAGHSGKKSGTLSSENMQNNSTINQHLVSFFRKMFVN